MISTNLSKRFVATLLILITAIASDAQGQGRDELITLNTPTGNIEGSLRTAEHPNGMVALIISGSGPTDRNGNNAMMTNNSLRMLADSLSSMGVSSVRYDKRGVAKSMSALKREEDIRFEDYIKDAEAWIKKLKKDKRFSRVVVIGHSEGSLIGMIAAKRAAADMFVSVAGIAERANITILRQIKASSAPMADTAAPILDSLAAGHLVQNAPQSLYMLFRPSVQPYMISWFKYNPLQEIQSLNIPILVIQGSTDLQVGMEDARALSKANSHCTLALVDGMNHVLKMASAIRIENMSAYTDPMMSLSSEFVQEIRKFLLR